MDEEDQLKFGFDLLDPTKIVPVELVPITPLGKMQLNRNPLNYFAETEQVMVSSITRRKTLEIQQLTDAVSTWPRCSRYRLYRRPLTPGTSVLLP